MLLTDKPHLKMSPSLPIEYSILGRGKSAPRRDDVRPQRAPMAMTYLAHGAPLNANTLGNVPPSGRVLYGHISVRTPDTAKYAKKHIPAKRVLSKLHNK